MLIFSMSVSVDGYINDRDGGFAWTPPTDELFGFHLASVRELGAYLLGRRLYEAMRVWETDPSMRTDDARDEFADVWCALPKVVFSRTLSRVEGNARLATSSVASEIAAAIEASPGRPVSVGGATLAAEAITLGLVDELRMFRHPIAVGGGTPYLPPITEGLPLDLIETRTFGGRVIYERYARAQSSTADAVAPSASESNPDPGRLHGSELIAFGKRTVTRKLELAGCRVTAPANPRDGKLTVRTPSGRALEVFVSTQRVGGYAFWTKRRLQPARDRYAAVVLVDDRTDPQLYLVPSLEWENAAPPLTDRDYVGQASEPEYGIELTESSLASLRRYAWSDRATSQHFT